MLVCRFSRFLFRESPRWARRPKFCRHKLAFLRVIVLGFSLGLRADSITLTGSITQSTQEGTGPAANNPSLNKILDGDPFSLKLGFNGSITAPGTYNGLTGVSLLFKPGHGHGRRKLPLPLMESTSTMLPSILMAFPLSARRGEGTRNHMSLNCRRFARRSEIVAVRLRGFHPTYLFT